MSSSSRRLVPAVALAAALITASALPAIAQTALPGSIAAAGDSITRAYNTGLLYADNPAGSWSTGTSSTVVSHYSRLLARTSAISGKNLNVARTGAKVADLAGQLATAAAARPGYLTILIGANDACAGSEAGMTSLADFRTRVASALAAFSTASPESVILLASIPDVYQLWSLFKSTSGARSAWSLFGICQSLLARPTSTLQADVDRRLRVRQRVVDYNTILAAECARIARCRWDGGVVFQTAFTKSDITTRDYFHPSVAGQKKLAAATWGASYWAP